MQGADQKPSHLLDRRQWWADAGLVHLNGIKALKNLNLQNTKVTQEGVDKLKAALPKCKTAFP